VILDAGYKSICNTQFSIYQYSSSLRRRSFANLAGNNELIENCRMFVLKYFPMPSSRMAFFIDGEQDFAAAQDQIQ
jgi:hypothetical protein